MTRKLYPYTSKGTGETVYVFAVSFVAIMDSLKREPEWAEPQPPYVTMDVAGQTVTERNWGDPDFPKSHAIWQRKFNEEATLRLIKRLAMVQNLTEEQKTAVDEWRKVMEEPGMVKNNKLLWLYEFALTDKDIENVVTFAASLADPSEERIQEAASGFQAKI